MPALIKAGVYSFKVEGRIKGASYVHTVIDSFRKQIDGYIETGELTQDGERLYKVFNQILPMHFYVVIWTNRCLLIIHVIILKSRYR